MEHGLGVRLCQLVVSLANDVSWAPTGSCHTKNTKDSKVTLGGTYALEVVKHYRKVLEQHLVFQWQRQQIARIIMAVARYISMALGAAMALSVNWDFQIVVGDSRRGRGLKSISKEVQMR